MKKEIRTFKGEIRKAADGRKLTGTAVVFNQLSQNLGGYREQIDPGAFDGCEMDDVRCLINHDESLLLGRTSSKTLSLSRDIDGLKFECETPDTSYARDLAACMDRGDIDGCSFSFSVAPGGSDWSEDPASGAVIRTVKKIARLYDVGPVTFPAYTQTSSEIRSSADILAERPGGLPTAGQTAPPAISAAETLKHLRRKLELAYYQHV